LIGPRSPGARFHSRYNKIMATKPLVSIDDYLLTSYPERDCEFVDGALIPKSMPPLSLARVQKILLRLFARWEAPHLLFAFPELRLRVAADRCLIPDVCVFAAAEPTEEVPSSPPYIVAEILSPDDRMSYLLDKLRSYRLWGVPHIWVLDPASRSVYTFSSGGLLEQHALPLPEHGLALTLDELVPRPA